MENEFGYMDVKPFKECDTDKQIFTTILTDEKGLELKINGTEGLSIFDIENIPQAIYVVDSKLTAITASRIKIVNSDLASISSSKIKSDLYFIKQGLLQEDGKIKHFTMNTKIKKLYYYNDSINRVFGNDSIESKYKINGNAIKNIKISGKKVKDENIGNITIDKGNVIDLILKKDFTYNHNYKNFQEISIRDNSHIILKFKKGILFDEAYKYILLLDSVIYLMTFLKRRHKKILIKTFNGCTYWCRDMKIDDNKDVKDRNFLICDRKNSKDVFMNIFKNLCNIDDESKNALFPFLEFDTQQSSLEIKFLEYYKSLEYIKLKENAKKGKGKNPTYLLDVLKSNQNLKENYFGNQSNDEIEEEIRSLRNYYSHTGYYIENHQLPIPNENPKRYKLINDAKWLYDVFYFIRLSAYIEIYKLCGLTIDWNQIVYNL